MNKFECDKCGLCCMSIKDNPLAVNLDDGTGICKYFNKETKLCEIYENRPDICNVEKGYKYFDKLMTYDEYINMNSKVCELLKRRKL